MMSILNLTKWDMKFQWKYGFYAVYIIFTVIYVFILSFIPEAAKKIAVTIMIFSDPAAMGLFFMGALGLLEKSQHVDCAFTVSPVKVSTYIQAKIYSLALIGLLVSAVLAVAARKENYIAIFVGVFFASCFFSLCGLMVAMKSNTVNQFMIYTIPFEIIIFVPSIFYLFEVLESKTWFLHPGVAGLVLIYGSATYIEQLLCFGSLIVWCMLAFLLCIKVTKQAFSKLGGAS